MSTPWDILQAVKSLAESAQAAVVKIRKRPFHSADAGDPLPMLCLSIGTEYIADEDLRKGVRIDWPIQVVLFQARNATIEDPAQLQLQYTTREALRLALWKRLSDVEAVIGCKYDPGPAFDLAGLDEHFDVSSQLFTYRSSEERIP